MKLNKHYLKQGVAITCSSKFRAKDFLNELNNLGYKWINGSSLIDGETYFYEYYEPNWDETLYVIDSHNKTVGFSNKRSNNQDYMILPLSFIKI